MHPDRPGGPSATWEAWGCRAPASLRPVDSPGRETLLQSMAQVRIQHPPGVSVKACVTGIGQAAQEARQQSGRHRGARAPADLSPPCLPRGERRRPGNAEV